MDHFQSVRAKKQLGQHFLVDQGVLTTIISTAHLALSARVLEIGPGTGVLTEALAAAVGKDGLVLAVEADRDLVEPLRAHFKSRSQVKIVAGDVLAMPTAELLQPPYQIVANLPYSITSPVLTKFLMGDYRGRAGDITPRPESMTFLVQREVAERLTARPPHRERGILTVMIELFGSSELISIVPPSAFNPPPKVESAIIRIEVGEPRANPWSFHQLLKAGFANRRRQLHNSLAGSLHLGANEVRELLERANIDPMMRAEQLSLEQWLSLFAVVRPEGER